MANKPTPGRIVWFHPGKTDLLSGKTSTPLAAIVAFVHGDDRFVNLTVLDFCGNPHSRLLVPFWDGEDNSHILQQGSYCEWPHRATLKALSEKWAAERHTIEADAAREREKADHERLARVSKAIRETIDRFGSRGVDYDVVASLAINAAFALP